MKLHPWFSWMGDFRFERCSTFRKRKIALWLQLFCWCGVSSDTTAAQSQGRKSGSGVTLQIGWTALCVAIPRLFRWKKWKATSELHFNQKTCRIILWHPFWRYCRSTVSSVFLTCNTAQTYLSYIWIAKFLIQRPIFLNSSKAFAEQETVARSLFSLRLDDGNLFSFCTEERPHLL